MSQQFLGGLLIDLIFELGDPLSELKDFLLLSDLYVIQSIDHLLLTLLQLLDLTQKKVDLKIVLRRRWRIYWVLIGIDWRGRRIGVKGLGYRSDKGSKRWKILDLWQLLFLPCLFRLMVSTLSWREIASGGFS